VDSFLKLIQFEKLPRWLRICVILVSGGSLLYAGAEFVLTGATAMRVTIPHALFLALCAAGGLIVGQLAWTQGQETKYRGRLADEINGSGHSLMKSTNRWYSASTANNRPEAIQNWEEAKARMGESAELLRKKVNTTAATQFLQNQAGQPPAHMNLLGLPDGAAISDMWRRYTRLTEIEARVREGKEQIVYPPPSP